MATPSGAGEREEKGSAARSGPVRAVVVDDEPLARERLRTLLAGRPDVTIVAECADGDAAVEAIATERPDLVFLDVQMPELDGFDVLEALGEDALPVVVFVTAYDEYALRAFDVSAVDYLLKPFDRPRFERALARALERIAGRERMPNGLPGCRRTDVDAAPSAAAAIADDDLRAFLQGLRAARGYAERFVVRSDGRLSFVRAADIDWVDAAGNYVRLHVAGRAHLLRETMKSIETRLDPDVFVRVHRSAIINIDRVASLEPYFHGEYVVTMRDGAKLTSSRAYSARLRELLK